MARSTSPQTSIFLLSLFSLCFSAAIIGTASHVLYSYNNQQATNLWWLPVWPSHFDARGLETLIGASAFLVVLNMATLCTKSLKKYRSEIVILLISLSAIAAIVQIAFPAAINNAAPGTDSMQTWTCQWASTAGSPEDFSALCHESRFAYFASIPVFVIQLLLLGLGVQNLLADRLQRKMREEKGEELGSIMAPESLRGGGFAHHDGGSGKGSPEMHVYNSP